VTWRRSKHVTPRGEGTVFQQKARARMVSALAQSGGAWLPAMFPDATPAHAAEARAEGAAVLLDAGAEPLLRVIERQWTALHAGDGARVITLAVGPEGGFEPDELELMQRAAFLPASLGASVLRFETAAVAGVSAARALLEAAGEQPK
jgi:16S rRNA (uracil1498-N3)-methyltransferase